MGLIIRGSTMHSLVRRVLTVAVVITLILVGVAGTALATHYTCVPDADTACVNVVMSPSTLTADFWFPNPGGPVLMAEQHNVFEVGGTPGLSNSVFDVRSIKDSATGFGTLFTYPDTKVTVNWGAANTTRTITLTPRKVYVRGLLELTCNIKNQTGEDVGCSLTIDGAAPAENATLTPGQKATYVLDPGAHTIVVTLVGTQANLWAPATFTQNVTIAARATPKKVSANFSKAGHLLASIKQPGVVGDWYLDGAQVGTSAAHVDLWLTPAVSHKIEVKNLIDPLDGPGAWKNVSANASIPSGKTKTMTIDLKRDPAVPDVSGIVGMWTGERTGDNPMQVTITITRPCRIGSVCGSMALTNRQCIGGDLVLSSRTGTVFKFGRTNLLGTCDSTVSIYLQPQADGTLLYWSSFPGVPDKVALHRIGG